jgi:alpha-L-fucosidase
MRNLIRAIVIAAVISTASFALAAEPSQSPALTDAALAARNARLQWWREARFGLFIHWGPISLRGQEISWSRFGDRKGHPDPATNGIPAEEYDNLYKEFNPTNFDARAWADIARGAGMKYVVFVAKHWDGFCEWPTKTTDYNIGNSPFHRDICGEIAQAVHDANLRLGWYFCPSDLHDPDCQTPRNDQYLVRMRGQLRELLGDYGRIDLLWFDYAGHTGSPWDQSNTYHLIRSLQPNLVVNNRLDMAAKSDYGRQRMEPEADYATPEQKIGAYNDQVPWETCMTLGTQWAWKPNDDIKSLKQCVDILVRCAGGDGNLLLNVGPMPDGRIEARQIARLKEIGGWFSENGGSIYATRGGPWKPSANIASTRQGNTIFVHVLKWNADAITLPNIPKRIVASSLLAGGSVDVKQTAAGVVISVPPADRSALDTIIKLEVGGPAMDIPALPQ